MSNGRADSENGIGESGKVKRWREGRAARRRMRRVEK